MPKFEKGHKKLGGKVKGKSGRIAKLLEKIEASGKQSPTEILLEKMWDEDTEANMQIRIAETLLPYLERKQPTAIEQTNMNSLQNATEDELYKRLSELMAKNDKISMPKTTNP